MTHGTRTAGRSLFRSLDSELEQSSFGSAFTKQQGRTKSSHRQYLGNNISAVLHVVPKNETVEVATAGEKHASLGRLS